MAHELTHVVQQRSNGTNELQLEAGDELRSAGEGTASVIEVEAVLRTIYQRMDEAIVQEANYMIEQAIAQGIDPPTARADVAKWVVNARNQAKIKIRNWDLRVLRLLAEKSNQHWYRNPVGPSYNQLRYGDNSLPRPMRARPDSEIISGAKNTRPTVNKWLGRLRIAGRILIAIDIGITAWKVAGAPEVDRPRIIIRETGRMVGAMAGGWAGAKGGSAIGGIIGAWFGGAGAIPGAAIGGLGGAIVGGISGGGL